tara:strand:+ start:55 stop:297 length:243 start_codon:yes stop_codon:yes gene_type:complete
MAGGGSFTSDQRTANATADGQLVTGPCRVTSIQAAGAASSTVYCMTILQQQEPLILLLLVQKDYRFLFLEVASNLKPGVF